MSKCAQAEEAVAGSRRGMVGLTRLSRPAWRRPWSDGPAAPRRYPRIAEPVRRKRRTDIGRQAGRHNRVRGQRQSGEVKSVFRIMCVEEPLLMVSNQKERHLQ